MFNRVLDGRNLQAVVYLLLLAAVFSGGWSPVLLAVLVALVVERCRGI